MMPYHHSTETIYHKLSALNIHLNIDIYLRAWIQGSQYCRSEGLFKVTRQFKRDFITARPILPRSGTEHSHAKLAVYKHLVLQCNVSWSMHLFVHNNDCFNIFITK